MRKLAGFIFLTSACAWFGVRPQTAGTSPSKASSVTVSAPQVLTAAAFAESARAAALSRKTAVAPTNRTKPKTVTELTGNLPPSKYPPNLSHDRDAGTGVVFGAPF